MRSLAFAKPEGRPWLGWPCPPGQGFFTAAQGIGRIPSDGDVNITNRPCDSGQACSPVAARVRQAKGLPLAFLCSHASAVARRTLVGIDTCPLPRGEESLWLRRPHIESAEWHARRPRISQNPVAGPVRRGRDHSRISAIAPTSGVGVPAGRYGRGPAHSHPVGGGQPGGDGPGRIGRGALDVLAGDRVQPAQAYSCRSHGRARGRGAMQPDAVAGLSDRPGVRLAVAGLVVCRRRDLDFQHHDYRQGL